MPDYHQPRHRRRAPARSDGPMVHIGMRELYDLLLDVRDRVAELANERKRDTAEIKETKLKVDKLDERLSRLERLKWIVAGAAAAGGVVASRIVDALSLS